MLYQLAFLAFINGATNFIGSPKNKCLDIIWGGTRILIKIAVLIAVAAIVALSLWPLKSHGEGEHEEHGLGCIVVGLA